MAGNDDMDAKLERSKDIAQEIVESTATRVGRITMIITAAVSDVAREIGELITDGFEMREAARRAKADRERSHLPADDDPAARDTDDRRGLPSAPARTSGDADIIDAELADDADGQ